MMRNLEKYPITGNEVIKVLDDAVKDVVESGRVGGIDGMVLEGVRRYLIDNPRAVAAVVEALRVGGA